MRGLTTAASIWTTAAIGIVIGMGLYYAALIAEIMVLGTLSLFGWIESKVPAHQYARLTIRLPREANISESELRRVVSDYNVTSTNPSYHLQDGILNYEMTVRTKDAANFSKLAETLGQMDPLEFSLAHTGS
jgi:putative Mg2+ transporter-C (MgtC) family protein